MVAGDDFLRASESSRRFPACFLQGLAPSMFRWEVGYEGTSFQKKLELWSGKNCKMSKIGQGGPLCHPKNPKRNWAQKGPGPIWGPGSLYNSRVKHYVFGTFSRKMDFQHQASQVWVQNLNMDLLFRVSNTKHPRSVPKTSKLIFF